LTPRSTERRPIWARTEHGSALEFEKSYEDGGAMPLATGLIATRFGVCKDDRRYNEGHDNASNRAWQIWTLRGWRQ
jgi:hypothetical protein